MFDAPAKAGAWLGVTLIPIGQATAAHAEADAGEEQGNHPGDRGRDAVGRAQRDPARGDAQDQAGEGEDKIDREENGFHDIPLPDLH
jgi:hypothetical protein